MISTFIFILLLLILLIAICFDEKKALILYVVFSLTSPNLQLIGIEISFEILAFFLVLLTFLLKRNQVFTLYKYWPYRQRIWIYLYLIIISSFVGLLKYNSEINWIALFGYFRVICIIYMLHHLFKVNPEKQLDNIFSPILLINFIISIIQLAIPSSVQIFYDLYYKSSLTPLKEVLNLGYFNRAYGTFGTPVLLGVFSLFSFAIYLGQYIDKKECRFLSLKILMSVSCGLIALSKTAILGIPTLIICTLILSLFGVIKIKNKKILITPILVIAAFFFIINLLKGAGLPVLGYISFLSHPLDAFETRYDSETGILNETYRIINENTLLGVGPNSIGNAFVGDSMYINILYISGITGGVVFFCILIPAIIKNLIKKDTIGLLCSIAILLGGFAAPIHLSIISASLVAYIFSKAELKKIFS